MERIVLFHELMAAGPSRWFFDAWSTFYDLPPVQSLVYRPVHDAVLAALAPARPHRVLDVGCGTGLLATRLRRELGGATRVVGCDFSRGMLLHARARGDAARAQDACGPRVSWVQGDAARLPFGDASVDAIVSTEAFHWIPDQRAAAAEFLRVLVPGGLAIVALVNTPNEAVRHAFRLASRALGQPFDWPTRREMRTLLEHAGFEVRAQRRVFRVPAGLALPPVLTIAVRPPHRQVGAAGHWTSSGKVASMSAAPPLTCSI